MAEKFHFTAASHGEAQDALADSVARYGQSDADNADVIVALGGDGHMLQTVHRFLNTEIPIYGMNKGTIGFLMNGYGLDDLPERIERAVSTRIYPLSMTTIDENDEMHHAVALMKSRCCANPIRPQSWKSPLMAK